MQIWTRTSPVEVSTPRTSNTSSKLQELGWVSPGPSFRRFPDRLSAFWCRLFFLYIFLLYFCQKIIGPWQCRSMSSYVYAALSCNFYVLSFTQTMSLDRKKFVWWHEQSTNWVQLSQVVEYMRSAGISPKVPDIPDIPDDTLEEDFDKRFNM